MAPASHERGADAQTGGSGHAPVVSGGSTRLDDLLRLMAERDATDLHLKPMRPPLFRVRGKLVPSSGNAYSPAEIESLLLEIMPPAQRGLLDQHRRVEFGYSVPGVSRFRATVFYQRGTLVASFRRLPYELPSFDELRLPSSLQRVSGLTSGVVLIAGPSGAGKSTTVAALVREIVDRRLVHVMTIEEPIEYPLRDSLGSVTQQEIGSDTLGYKEGIDNALCQDSDVIAVDGEVEPELRAPLLDAADSDRLVIVSQRAESVVEALERWITGVPNQWQKKTRLRLAEVLKAAVALRLVENADGAGVSPAAEILWCTPRTRELIAAARIEELDQEIRNGDEASGMRTLNQSLAELVSTGTVSPEEALSVSTDPDELEAMLAPVDQRPRHDTLPEDAVAERPTSIPSPSRAEELLELEQKYDRLKSRYHELAGERDGRLADLERRLEEQQVKNAELSKLLAQLSDEKAQILEAVERESRRLEDEDQGQRQRLRELEEQLRLRESNEQQRIQKIEYLERERRRTVEMVEAHCRDYERRIARLQEKLREHGIDPL